ncbi:MAG: hypothetical protein ACPGUV_03865 [Polyangiales bacterium]
MSEGLIIQTDFAHLGEFNAAMADRVDDERLILYGPDAYADGERIAFAVYLGDGSVALQGEGSVVTCVDGGADRHSDARFDVVLDALELDATSREIFTAMLNIAVSEPPYDDAPPQSFEDAEGGDGATHVVSAADVTSALAAHPQTEALSMPEEVAFDAAFAAATSEETTNHTVDPGDEAAPESANWDSLAADEDSDATHVVGAAELSASITGEHTPMASQDGTYTAVLDVESEAMAGKPATVSRASTPSMAPLASYAPPPIVAPVWNPPIARLEEGDAFVLQHQQAVGDWEPAIRPQPEPRPMGQLFQYPTGTLPLPEHPPRPEGPLDLTPTGSHPIYPNADVPRMGSGEFAAPQAWVSPGAGESQHDLVPPAEDEFSIEEETLGEAELLESVPPTQYGEEHPA